MSKRGFVGAALAALLLLGTGPIMAGAATAQFGSLGNLGRLGARAAAPRLMSGREPISTSLPDAVWGDPAKDGWAPPGPRRPLTGLRRMANGGFVLQPGSYEFHDQSYCLHAGTHGPGGGEGYLYAPPKGSAQDAVMTIVRNSVAHPEIPQRTIQTLLWAIVARARFEDLSNEHRLVASQLLSQRQLASLNRSALDVLNSGPIANNLPSPLREIAQAEAQLRGMFASGASYGELERVAVLSGRVGRGPGSQAIPAGRWSQHPDGYWVRYLPVSYTNTVVNIWVPPGSAAIGREYDPAVHIAVPGDTARQRLIQSGRAYGG
ncbi:hypothetical protein [Sphingomonas sp.]|uniref:hypothetical protein n=1 Tax=Sphingomonas sp. TaxID=28214 RepID=UPI003B0007CA